jgi:hypothetical protein
MRRKLSRKDQDGKDGIDDLDLCVVALLFNDRLSDVCLARNAPPGVQFQ